MNGGEKCVDSFRWENLRERDYCEDIGVGGRIILKLVFVNRVG